MCSKLQQRNAMLPYIFLKCHVSTLSYAMQMPNLRAPGEEPEMLKVQHTLTHILMS